MLLASGAHALSLSIDSAATNPGNTANFTQDDLVVGRQNLSSLAVTNGGGTVADSIGATVNASTRYAAVLVADAGVNGNANRSANSDYSITFTTSAPGGWIYDIVIDTRRTGAVTLVNDGTVSASANIGPLTGQLDASPTGALGLAAGPSLSGNSGDNQGFDQTNQLVIANLSGSNTFTLRFSWNATANSSAGLFSTGADEAAVRLGLASTIGGTSAADYPGVGSRNIANDGHFVNIGVIAIVPEPGTAMLAGLGLLGLAAAGRRQN